MEQITSSNLSHSRLEPSLQVIAIELTMDRVQDNLIVMGDPDPDLYF